MADRTGIEWTDATWNPISGCSLVSPGCTNCYAMGVAHRFRDVTPLYAGLTQQVNGTPVWTGKIAVNERVIDQPLRWKRYLNFAGGHGFHGDRVIAIRNVGKRADGRMLDGRTWGEFPGDVEAA